MNKRNNLPKSNNTRDNTIVDSELLDTLMHVSSACQAHGKEQVTLNDMRTYFRQKDRIVSPIEIIRQLKGAVREGYVRIGSIEGEKHVYLHEEGKKIISQNLSDYDSQEN